MGASRISSILDYYNRFLAAMADQQIRNELAEIRRDVHSSCSIFAKLKMEAQAMNSEISKFIKSIYDENHPIHLAILL
ncbi:MAG: hypothetical protein U1E81_10305 [Xanthobacteraceae bacterium]